MVRALQERSKTSKTEGGVVSANSHIQGEMNALISIVVPVYNVELYIDECIESIRNQTYTNIEIIIINDGSTDGSLNKCIDHANQDSRIKVISQSNMGLCNAKKKGIRAAKGQYIGFVDGDDYIDDNMFELLFNSLTKNDADIAHCGLIIGDIQKKECAFKRVELTHDRVLFINDLLCGDLFFSPGMPLKLYRRDLLLSSYLGLPDSIKNAEDTAFLFDCLVFTDCISFIPETPYHYRRRKGSLTNNTSVSTLFGKIRSCEYIYDRINALPELNCLKKACERYILRETKRYINILSGNMTQYTQYCISDISKFRKKRIILFGAGAVGRSYYSQLCKYDDITIVAWVDSCYSEYDYDYRKVVSVDEGIRIGCDYIIIAVKSVNMVEEIRNQLEQKGIERNKIFWEKPNDN